MRFTLVWIVWFFVVSQGTPALATVDIESQRTGKEKNAFSARVNLSLSEYTGSTEKLQLGIGSRLGWIDFFEKSENERRFTRRHSFLIGSFDREEQGGDVFLKKGFLHVRHTEMVRPRFGYEVFGQYQSDAFRRLNKRVLGGIGGRWLFYSSGFVDIAVGTAVMNEFELLNGAGEGTTGFWSSSYVSGSVGLVKDKVTVSSTTYFQPSFDDWNDRRITTTNAVIFNVTDILKWSFSLDWHLDSRPPQGVTKSDRMIQNTLILEWSPDES